MGYSTRDAAHKLKKLGFVETKKRGKGSHRWFVLYVGGRHELNTMLPAEREQITDKTLQDILRKICLTKDEWARVGNDIGESEYLQILKAKNVI